MCAWPCLCTCVHMCITRLRTCICPCAYRCTYMCLHAFIWVYVSVCPCVYMCACVCTYGFLYVEHFCCSQHKVGSALRGPPLLGVTVCLSHQFLHWAVTLVELSPQQLLHCCFQRELSLLIPLVFVGVGLPKPALCPRLPLHSLPRKGERLLWVHPSLFFFTISIKPYFIQI